MTETLAETQPEGLPEAPAPAGLAARMAAAPLNPAFVIVLTAMHVAALAAFTQPKAKHGQGWHQPDATAGVVLCLERLGLARGVAW